MRWTLATLALMLLLLGSGCKQYEYEEEIFLEVDGSGRMRVSGSRLMLASLHGLAEASPRAVSRHFEADGLDVTSVRETERSGRSFVHVEGAFTDWNALCRHPAFAERPCRLVLDDEAGERRLELEVPPFDDDVETENLASLGLLDELIAVRFHFPSSVLEHNAPDGIERGNILSWERRIADHVRTAPLEIRARFNDRSVLSATVRILALAAGTVLFVVVLALSLMVWKGRRQLRAEASPSPTR